jgi:hypothetical protein
MHALGGDQQSGGVLELPVRRERHPEGVEIVGNIRAAHDPAHVPKGFRASGSFSCFCPAISTLIPDVALQQRHGWLVLTH